MSKGIILVDEIPDKCEDCPCCHRDDYNYYCQTNDKKVDWETRPDWCPIQELPERKSMGPGKTVIRAAQDEGWNNCLDKLLGKEYE